jgi:hypothetical protein
VGTAAVGVTLAAAVAMVPARVTGDSMKGRESWPRQGEDRRAEVAGGRQGEGRRLVGEDRRRRWEGRREGRLAARKNWL